MSSRRAFLGGMAAASFTAELGWAAAGQPVALSAAKAADGRFLLAGLAADGSLTFRIPLPARGHAGAAHPRRAEAVAIARRPGAFALVIDCISGKLRHLLKAPDGAHFYGHGAYAADGSLFFTTENDIASGKGLIGVWDPSLGYVRIDQFASGGVGPHEILRLPSGVLAVANGGIRTHPGSGREKLNLETMRPNLSLFDLEGRLLDQAEVPASIHQNSLRQIAAGPGGTVICGFQWQGDPFDAPPLVGFYDGAGKLQFAPQLDPLVQRRLDGYIGSVASLGEDAYAASCPRAGLLLTFDAEGRATGSFVAEDVCGLAALSADTAIVTTGFGKVLDASPQGLRHRQSYPLAFDNHLVRLSG